MRVNTTPRAVPGLIKSSNKRAKKGIMRSMKRSAQRARSLMVRATPTDQGQLKASWKVRKAAGSGIGDGSLAAVLLNDAPHAGVVEGGARPHPVSNDGFYAIFLWARRHGFSGSRRKFQRGGRSRIQGPQQVRVIRGFQFADADVPAAEVALAICRKIKARGQEATYFVRDRLPELQKMATEELVKEMQKAMKPRGKGRKK